MSSSPNPARFELGRSCRLKPGLPSVDALGVSALAGLGCALFDEAASGASQFLAAFGQSDAETHEKRGIAEPRFASRLATILPLPEGEGRGEGAFDVSLTYQKIEMLPAA